MILLFGWYVLVNGLVGVVGQVHVPDFDADWVLVFDVECHDVLLLSELLGGLDIDWLADFPLHDEVFLQELLDALDEQVFGDAQEIDADVLNLICEAERTEHLDFGLEDGFF